MGRGQDNGRPEGSQACQPWEHREPVQKGCSWHKTGRSQQEGSECCCTSGCSAQLMGHWGAFRADGAAPDVRTALLRLCPGSQGAAQPALARVREWLGLDTGAVYEALAKGWMEVLLHKLWGVFCKHKRFHINPHAREISTKQTERKQRCLAPRPPATAPMGEP